MTDGKPGKIEQRAYEIWEREGRPHGKALEHWDQAVAEIAREEEEAQAKAAKTVKKAPKAKKPAPKSATAAKPAAKGKTAAKPKKTAAKTKG